MGHPFGIHTSALKYSEYIAKRRLVCMHCGRGLLWIEFNRIRCDRRQEHEFRDTEATSVYKLGD